ncbi:MAG: pantoate--beta-alanine ligase [Bacteroidia bacterium]|nr:pantoate--beta-alanine ligase [Bacteroidia bacterium]MCC6767752.1 pantoate--beta-alanine ligase [Bacteroidia bacterium]
MQIVRIKSELTAILKQWKATKELIGFVPTMGALHLGHVSLVNRAKAQNKYCVVSIFVNPTQFNERDDYQRYPRNEAGDLALLKEAGADLVFIPDEAEMYGAAYEQAPAFDFEGLDKPMEGRFRAGHFNGVVTIVDKLFRLVMPDKAYFGQKDFQQLAIIRLLARKRFPDIEIVACPIIRETSGLAMSSRNELLTEEERIRAGAIAKALFALAEKFGKYPLAQLHRQAIKDLEVIGVPEYLELVQRDTLQVVDEHYKGAVVACVAIRLGKVRLIDNIEIP